MKKSPYIRDDERLSDVVAAIQAMGTYKYYKLEPLAKVLGAAGLCEDAAVMILAT